MQKLDNGLNSHCIGKSYPKILQTILVISLYVYDYAMNLVVHGLDLVKYNLNVAALI